MVFIEPLKKISSHLTDALIVKLRHCMILGVFLSAHHFQLVSLVATASVTSRSVDAFAVSLSVVAKRRMQLTFIDVHALIPLLMETGMGNGKYEFTWRVLKCQSTQYHVRKLTRVITLRH